jgi:diadenosine tetraphosphate (Ap4A) HIT family hydrolase
VEDEHHLAFLSIFPNTDGFTVVIPKKHYPSYAFDMPPQALADLVLATQKVANFWIKPLMTWAVRGCF